MRALTTSGLVLFAFAAAPPPADAAFNYALLVGNDYQAANQQWASDAVNVHNALVRPGGASAAVWSNARITRISGGAGTVVTRAAVLNALSNFAAVLRPGDGFLFYFSGHGSYFNQPSNPERVGPALDRFDETLYITGSQQIGDDELRQAFGRFRAGVNKVAFLDTCFAGGFWNGRDAGDLERVANTTLFAAAAERRVAPGNSIITPNFSRDLVRNRFDLKSMGGAALRNTFNRIRPVGAVTFSNRRGDPDIDPTVYDPESFTIDETIPDTSEFFTNAVPEPASLALLAAGGVGLAAARRARRAR